MTDISTFALIAACVLRPKFTVVIANASHRRGRNEGLAGSCFAALEQLPSKFQIKAMYSYPEQKILFANGSQVCFWSYGNASSFDQFMGLQADWLVFHNPHEFSQLVVGDLILRLNRRHPELGGKVFWLKD